MSLPRLLIATVAAALALPTAAQAAPPWSDPVTVPGSQGQAGAPVVLGDAIAFNGAGSFPGAPLLRAPLDGSAPAERWPGATNFYSEFGAFGVGDQLIYAGSNGHRRVNVALASGVDAPWRVSLRGPKTGGARSAAAPGAAVFSTFGRGDMGYVYLVRQTGEDELGPTLRLSKRGHIRSVAVASNKAGDVLVAWDRSGTIESRMWSGRSDRLTRVKELGETEAAMHLTVALNLDRRAIVAWVDQRVSEGDTGMNARVMATARGTNRGFLLPARPLEVFPDPIIPGGRVIEAAYMSTGRGIIAWSGRSAVRAAFVDSRLVRAPQDLAPIAPDETRSDLGFGDLAVSERAGAVITMVAPADATGNNQVLAAPVAPGAASFGPAEAVSAPGAYLHWPSAAFEGDRVWLAWQVPPAGGAPNRIEVAQRPSP
jgi:hypothetical protein